jgi:hypothetical protein
MVRIISSEEQGKGTVSIGFRTVDIDLELLKKGTMRGLL